MFPSGGAITTVDIAGAFGILISTVGKDFMTSIDRFTFGINELTEGIGFIPVVVGLFAMSGMKKEVGEILSIIDKLSLYDPDEVHKQTEIDAA